MDKGDGFREGLNPSYDPDLPDDGQITISCQAPFAKISRFAFYPNQFTESRRPTPQRGVSRSSRTRDGMRWTRQRRARAGIAGRDQLRERTPARRRTMLFTDGEVVWSWHPLLVLNLRRRVGPTGRRQALNPLMTVAT